MKEKKVFFHLGSPKCASTTIQDNLSKCGDIDYVGIKTNSDNQWYWEENHFALLFDRVLRFTCDNEEYWKAIVDEYIQKSDKEVIVFSSENVTLRFLSWDVPTHIKLKFLQKILPSNTQYIYVYKNPVNLLISLYKEKLLMGYSDNFYDFCEELYTYRDISMFNDILLEQLLSNEIFCKKNFNLIFLEKNFESAFVSILNIHFNRNNEKNKSIDSIESEIIREYNLNMNDFRSSFDVIEKHRAYFDVDDKDKRYSLSRKRLVRKNVAKSLKPYSKKSTASYQISLNVKNSIINSLLDTISSLDNKAHIIQLNIYIEEVRCGKFK